VKESERIAARTTPCPICRRKFKAIDYDPEARGRVRLPAHNDSEFGSERCTGGGRMIAPQTRKAARS